MYVNWALYGCVIIIISLLVYVYQSRTIDNIHFFVPMQYRQIAHLRKHFRLIQQDAYRCSISAPISSYVRQYNQWVNADREMRVLRTADGWMQTRHETSVMPDPKWLNYGIMFKGTLFDKNATRCPAIAFLAYEMRAYINVCGFSMLRGQSTIDWHTDHTGLQDNSLAYHLGLIVPRKKCTLFVGSKSMREKEGRVIIFDSNIRHSAVNNSNLDRIILYIDFSITPRHTFAR